MDKIRVTTIFVFGLLTVSSQAAYRIYAPLEIKNNGQLPDNSIVFIGGSTPVTPEEPEEPSNGACSYDIGSSTLFAVISQYGDTAEIAFYQGQRISNGVKGQLMLSAGTASYYEICLNGQAPIPYVPEPEWENGTCKYDSGLGLDAPRYWSQRKAQNNSSIDVFYAAGLGSYEGSARLLYGSAGVAFPNDWTSNTDSELEMSSNYSFVYNGYKYSRGALRNTKQENYNSELRDVYYHEICRIKL